VGGGEGGRGGRGRGGRGGVGERKKGEELSARKEKGRENN